MKKYIQKSISTVKYIMATTKLKLKY